MFWIAFGNYFTCNYVTPDEGLEPSTTGLKVLRSTN